MTNQPAKTARHHVTTIGLVAAFLLATTYPYDFRTNGAQFSGRTAAFDSSGILIWKGPEIDYASQRFELHLDLKTSSSFQYGPARILTISRDHYHANFTVGQMGPHLVIRVRRTDSEYLGMPQYVIEDVFRHAEKPVSIEIEISDSGFMAYINDELRLFCEFTNSPFRFWDPKYELVLGNEHTWDRPWLGEIHAAVILTGEQDLEVLDKKYLVQAGYWHQFRQKLFFVSDHLFDLIVNLVAMIPFGFATARSFRRRHVFHSVVLWSLVVLCAEAMQVVIPQRFPSVSDLVLNVSGIGIGAILWVKFNLRKVINSDSRTSQADIKARNENRAR